MGRAAHAACPGVATGTSRPQRLHCKPALLPTPVPSAEAPCRETSSTWTSQTDHVLSSRTRTVNQAAFAAAPPLQVGARPLAGPPTVATRHREPALTRYRNKTGESCDSWGFVAARPAVQPVAWLPLRGPLTGLTPALASGKSRPSCASRRLFRRYHLRRQSLPCGKPSAASPGISKDRPSAGSSAEESTPAGSIAAACFGMNGATGSSSFRLRGSSPP